MYKLKKDKKKDKSLKTVFFRSSKTTIKRWRTLKSSAKLKTARNRSLFSSLSVPDMATEAGETESKGIKFGSSQAYELNQRFSRQVLAISWTILLHVFQYFLWLIERSTGSCEKDGAARGFWDSQLWQVQAHLPFWWPFATRPLLQNYEQRFLCFSCWARYKYAERNSSQLQQ